MALPLVFALSILILCKLAAAQQQYSSSNSSFIDLLPHSFNFTIRPHLINASYTSSSTISQNSIWIPNLDDGLFFPILSSPSFNSSSAFNSTSRGFSLGFYFSCTNRNGTKIACSLYLALCAGSTLTNVNIGSTANSTQLHVDTLQLISHGSSSNVTVVRTADGLAIPVWIANVHHPIENVLDASLAMVADSGSSSNILSILQLRDGDEVLWNISNVGMMEVQDSGYFLLYDSSGSERKVVFTQSPITDILLAGQQLTVGMELTSNDSAYSARMEKGGLVLVLNSLQELAPYWIFPLFRNPDSQSPGTAAEPTINQLVTSPPCAGNDNPSPAYLHFEKDDRYDDVMLALVPGSCPTLSYIIFDVTGNGGQAVRSWSFLRLEIDGRLYVYTVSSSFAVIGRHVLTAPTTTYTLNRTDRTYKESVPGTSITGILQDVGICDVPLVCGPLGVCSPGVGCSCPDFSFFEPLNQKDIKQGCMYRRSNLPNLCTGMSNTSGTAADINSTTSLLQLPSTTSLFLLTGWTFNSSAFNSTNIGYAINIDACKTACLLDCSCYGISYQVSTSSCFLMAHSNISFISVVDADIMVWNYTTTLSPVDMFITKQIYQVDYVTYLKVALTQNTSSESSKKGVSGPFPTSTLIGIICGILACLFLALGAYKLRKRRREHLQQAKEDEELRDILPLLPARFSYKELRLATKGFSKLVGTGGCGSVYAGTLSDERRVAVKVLDGVLQGTLQSSDFLAEVATVGRTGHQNIVRLVGFCWQVSHRILVYEYVEGGSLDRWLFNNAGAGDESVLLDWQKRYNIALGVARGIHYLHEGCEQAILHFDIKPQNILLDDAFVAKIADFGLSKLMQRDKSYAVTGVRGTPGYIAPEWFSHGTVSKKNDIYSLGMVMLEIVAGRKLLEPSLRSSSRSSISDAGAGAGSSASTLEWHLPSWAAQKLEQGALMDVVDEHLQNWGFDELQAERLLYTALWCIQEDPAARPKAATIVEWLENRLNIEQPRPTGASGCHPDASWTSLSTSYNNS